MRSWRIIAPGDENDDDDDDDDDDDGVPLPPLLLHMPPRSSSSREPPISDGGEESVEEAEVEAEEVVDAAGVAEASRRRIKSVPVLASTECISAGSHGPAAGMTAERGRITHAGAHSGASTKLPATPPTTQG